ncbi:Pyridoxal dependent decarboxylase pyridoxal binding domain [Trypanosoma vivax]|uniref:ornithine decarboxylase n=1 Tax=Trypanosoma vivax (strain Y486) TaxID=1055687 RepID=G0U8P4_TRYVY|nr:putative ornithine decarboxylase [Trypanosoma vivax]KAH8619013.1 Pyridoxal dependent decarboxylase pyridoxal binding domain [Trypanosoma vivax]CCC53971.1 putative ornithine decarboxylase [Trypanosoma vivax Y486]
MECDEIWLEMVVDSVLAPKFIRDHTAKEALRKRIDEATASDLDAFIITDLAEVLRSHCRWVATLPRVAPFYAVKCNDSEGVLKTLAAVGVGFDCASQSEIKTVLALGVAPEKIIYANPCKQISHIRYARDCGVEMMTFDSEGELDKVASTFPTAKMVLRIATDDSKAQCPLSVKFGAPAADGSRLLQRARGLHLDVIGVSFHVGSGCSEPGAFTRAIRDARSVFDAGAAIGFNMRLLDIGGGFPGTPDASPAFEDLATVVNEALAEHFPPGCGIEIIAEPGRYYVASALTLATSIIGKKTVRKKEGNPGAASEQSIMYYINDGLYGSFNCILYDHACVTPIPYLTRGPGAVVHPSSVWGPTCDGLDCVVECCQLPEMRVGEWLIFENMGAYTTVGGSTFNGFQRPEVFYTLTGAPCEPLGEGQATVKFAGAARAECTR